jgi:hypothetical protein
MLDNKDGEVQEFGKRLQKSVAESVALQWLCVPAHGMRLLGTGVQTMPFVRKRLWKELGAKTETAVSNQQSQIAGHLRHTLGGTRL